MQQHVDTTLGSIPLSGVSAHLEGDLLVPATLEQHKRGEANPAQGLTIVPATLIAAEHKRGEAEASESEEDPNENIPLTELLELRREVQRSDREHKKAMIRLAEEEVKIAQQRIKQLRKALRSAEKELAKSKEHLYDLKSESKAQAKSEAKSEARSESKAQARSKAESRAESRRKKERFQRKLGRDADSADDSSVSWEELGFEYSRKRKHDLVTRKTVTTTREQRKRKPTKRFKARAVAPEFYRNTKLANKIYDDIERERWERTGKGGDETSSETSSSESEDESEAEAEGEASSSSEFETKPEAVAKQ